MEKNIVEMNQYAGIYRRQNFEDHVVRVAVDLRYMRRVDEQNIAGCQPTKFALVDRLQVAFNYPNALVVFFFDERSEQLRIGLDKGAVHSIARTIFRWCLRRRKRSSPIQSR